MNRYAPTFERSQLDAVGRLTREMMRRGLFGLPHGTVFMEAHSGLSARIADACGFDGIWASGFSISTAKGRHDCGEISLTELAQVVAEMADVTDRPILTDADTGFGDFNNCRLAARQLLRAGARGMVIEDKVFPKANSFLDADHHLLAIDEFVAKIRAVKDAMGEGFTLIARTETFISGGTLDQALERADAFADAGADGIFIHSKRPADDELRPIVAAWQTDVPLVIAPTMYGDVPFDDFAALGIGIVLCANHSMRASARAMMDTCSALRGAERLTDISDRLMSIPEIFALLDYDELDRTRARLCRPRCA